MVKKIRIPIRYLPNNLSKKDTNNQLKMLIKSRKLYKSGKYFTRKKVSTFKSKKSNHIVNVQKIYNIDKVLPNKELAKKTGCSIKALRQIVKKGEGAYFSSGSRPNQTAQSWGLARLASSITSGKAAAVDYDILDKGCDHNKTAFRLAKKSRQKYGYGHSKTRSVKVKV